MSDIIYDAFNKEILTVSSSAVGLDAAKYNPPNGIAAQKALITVEENDIRYWYDGSTPTGSEGHLGAVGAVIELEGANSLKNFKAIATGADAKLMVTYER